MGKGVGNSAMEGGNAEDLIAPYKDTLDEKAVTALNSIGRAQVEHILQNFEEKKGDLKNASAWVSRAVANLIAENAGGKGGYGGYDAWGGKGGFGGFGGCDGWGGFGGWGGPYGCGGYGKGGFGGFG